MALDVTQIKMIELSDVMVSELTADAGAAPTYATGKPLTGLVKMGVKPVLASAELEGDGQTLDVYAKAKGAEVDLELAVMNMDVFCTMLGITKGTSGSTPNQVATMGFGVTNKPKFFKIEGRWTYPGLGLGDVHLVAFKCKVTDPSAIEVEDANGKFGTMKIKAKAVPAVSNGKIFDVVANETAVALTS
jgi:hypothetical protein